MNKLFVLLFGVAMAAVCGAATIDQAVTGDFVDRDNRSASRLYKTSNVRDSLCGARLAIVKRPAGGWGWSFDEKADEFGVVEEDGLWRVKTAGMEFVLPEKGQLQVLKGTSNQQLLSYNIRVGLAAGVGAPKFDYADDTVRVVEATPTRIVLRAERSLAVDDWGAGTTYHWDAARMTVDYVFAKGVPGVIVVQRLKAVKPYSFVSWNVPFRDAFARYAVDGTDLRRYPTTAEFTALPGGYRTNAGAYLTGEATDGRLWYLGREFETFCPAGDGKPGGLMAGCDTIALSSGRQMSVGEVVTSSVCIGCVRTPEDIAVLRAFRAGGDTLPVLDYESSWDALPVIAWRGETKDYRPVAGLDWEGKDDLSFSLKLAQDADGIRVFADVTDDLVRNTFSGKDKPMGDSVEMVFADADGKKDLVRVVSANEATKTANGYAVEVSVRWNELAEAGIDRSKGVRFNVCVTDQDKGAAYENWMGVADGIKGGRDLSKYPFLDLAGVRTTYEAERPVLPDKVELQKKIDELKTANDRLPSKTEDEYTACLKAMTDYFLDFMQKDLNCGDTVWMSHERHPVDDDYRYYMNDRINKNAEYLFKLQRELKARQADLAAGKVKPLRTVKYPKGVRPVVEDGGFKIAGKEILLIGPDTWTNVKGWQNADISWIGRTGFNQLDCFYIGGTNYADVVRRCDEEGLYCVWGAAVDTDSDFAVNPPEEASWSEARQNAYRDGMGASMGSLVPSNPAPLFVFQVTFPEQWTRTRESTEEWAREFRSHLGKRFGSLDVLNATLGTSYADWTGITFAAALENDALKYESFRYRMETNMKRVLPNQRWLETRYGLPRSVHFSTHYNIVSLDPLVTLADFEALWSMFDIVGFDGGFGLEGSEWAFDFPKGGFEYDFARSCYPEKPVANNENHVVGDGTYYEHSNEETYLSNMLAFLMGQNSSSVWDWANTRHTYGEYVFTRANMYHEMVRCALDLRRYPEEIAAFRRCPNPPFRIFHSLPSLAERDPYVRSLYGLYGACSFTGWANRFLTERQLRRGELVGVKVIVVPDARRVSDETFAALATFAKGGGVVLVDGEEALTKDAWGKPVPSRKQTITAFPHITDQATRTRYEALNAALDGKGVEPPLKVTVANGMPPFGVMWRTAKTAAGADVAFVTNLSKEPVTVRIGRSATGAVWKELLNGRDASGDVVLKSMDLLLLKAGN